MQIKNRPLFLNTDDDYLVIPNTDTVNCVDLKISKGNGDYVLTPVNGTSAISNSVPDSGENKYIGYVKNESRNELFYFIWNGEGRHSIFRYRDVEDGFTLDESITLVLESSELNFSKTSWINGDTIYKNNINEVLLYFTDGINPPRKINVNKAIRHTEGDFNSGYPEIITQEYISEIKSPPTQQPEFVFEKDGDISYNNFQNTALQFAYRYIYDDDEYSAYSPYSLVAISPNQRNNLNNETFLDPYNKLVITLKTGSPICDHIEIIARENPSSEWKTIKRIPNNTSVEEVSFDFYNDGNYSIANSAETNKLYDNVPITSQTTKIAENRLFHGGNLEGYDLSEEIESLKDGQTAINLTPKYDFEKGLDRIKIPASITGTGKNEFVTYVDFNFAGITVQSGQVFYLDFNTFLDNRIVWGTFPQRSEYTAFYGSFSSVYTVKSGDTLADVIEFFKNSFYNASSGSTSVTYVANTSSGINSLRLTLRIKKNGQSRDPLPFDYFFRVIKTNPLTNNSFYVAGNQSSSSFKSGAKHPIGIVYYDSNNRSSTVNTWSGNEVYVKFFSERANFEQKNFEGYGSASIDWNISVTPPDWATHYQWVYSGNKSIDNFLQYSCFTSYVAQNPEYTAKASDNTLYLSMRSFQGKPDSYKEQFGAKPQYNFVEGDRLRIISYYDPVTKSRVFPSGSLDFKINSFEFYESNSDNPVYNSLDKFNTTGWFLGIENNDLDGWSYQDRTYWSYTDPNDTEGGSAVFEIYRPKSNNVDGIYYEFGERYDIGDSGLETRYHKGSIRDQNETVTYSIERYDKDDAEIVIVSNELKIVTGDYVDILDINGNVISSRKVTSILLNDLGEYVLFFSGEFSFGGVAASISVSGSAAGNFANGDVWFKPRLIRQYRKNISSRVYISHYVEDYYANDFTDTNYWSKGRANAYSPDSEQMMGYSMISWSDPFFQETYINGLSSFNLSTANFKYTDPSFGTIRYIDSDGFNLVVFKENKVSRIPIGRSVIDSANGQGTLTLTNNVLGSETHYSGNYGCGFNPESIARKDDRWYFTDLKKGKVLRLSGNGITPISDYKMSSFFRDKANESISFLSTLKVYGGYDNENDLYLLSKPSNNSRRIGLKYSSFQQRVLDEGGVFKQNKCEGDSYKEYSIFKNIEGVSIGIENTTIPLPSEFSKNPPSVKWDTEDRLWEKICENWENWGGDFIDLDNQDSFINNKTPFNILKKTTIPVLVKISSETKTFYLQATYNFQSGTITIPNNQECSGIKIGSSSTPNFKSTENLQVSFSEKNNRWISFYSYAPEGILSINNCYLSFFNDGVENQSLYRHSSSYTSGYQYISQSNPSFKVSFNASPSVVKDFRSASIEGEEILLSDSNFSTNISVEQNQTSYEVKEGQIHLAIPYTSSTGDEYSDLANISLGLVFSNSGTRVDFSHNQINRMGIFVGASLKDENNNIVGTIAKIGKDYIFLNNPPSSSLVGKSLFMVNNNAANGSLMKGSYCLSEFDFRIDSDVDEDRLKIYAVNTWVTESKLHN